MNYFFTAVSLKTKLRNVDGLAVIVKNNYKINLSLALEQVVFGKLSELFLWNSATKYETKEGRSFGSNSNKKNYKINLSLALVFGKLRELFIWNSVINY